MQSAGLHTTHPASEPYRVFQKLWPYLLLSVWGLLLYANTFHHEYAYDDDLIVCNNTYVLKGVQGLGDIFQKDIFQSYYEQLHVQGGLQGGRFRPLSLATFALEQEFIGTLPNGIQDSSWDANHNHRADPQEDVNQDGLWNEQDVLCRGMALRHVNNVWLYILSVCLLFAFLQRFVFKEQVLPSFAVCLLFLTHPLHTEVVANVKSRDEILSFLFMTATLYQGFVYLEGRKLKILLFTLLCYMAALCSKEYGVTLLMLLPLGIYVLQPERSWKDMRYLLGGLVLVFLIYYGLRSHMVAGFEYSEEQNKELLNNPFLFATDAQSLATKLFINLKYIMLLLWPAKLSADYGYQVIPYQSWSNIGVWLSMAVLATLVITLILLYRRRHPLLFPLAYFLFNLLLINNFFFSIGATMGERLIYHSSFGFCLLLAGVGYGLTQRYLKQLPWLFPPVILCVALLYSYKTIQRNPAWKNNFTLYSTDVKTYPQSAMLNGNACGSYLDRSNSPKQKEHLQALLDTATVYGERALHLHPGYYFAHINLGLVKAKQGKMDSATFHWLKARELSPNEKQLPMLLSNSAVYYFNQGMKLYQASRYDSAIIHFNIAATLKPSDFEALYYLGLSYKKSGDTAKARMMFSKGLSIVPHDSLLLQAIKQLP